jgi:DNA replication protein DnaC
MSTRKRPPGPDDILDRLRRHLEFLDLKYALGHLDEYLTWVTREKPAATVLLERIFSEQAAAVRERRVERRFVTSGLPERKTLEAFDWAFQPSLDKSLILEIATLDFMRKADDLVITGKAGTGKSHILKAIGLRACQQQIGIRYARCVDLLDQLYAGLADGTYPRRLRRWASAPLLLIDDVGLGQVRKRDDEPTAAHMLFNLIDRRHGNVSTALTSNIKLSAWGRYLGDATLAVAILDRMAMRSIRVDIDGPSYRQQAARDRAKERGTKLPDDYQNDETTTDKPKR